MGGLGESRKTPQRKPLRANTAQPKTPSARDKKGYQAEARWLEMEHPVLQKFVFPHASASPREMLFSG